MCELEIEIFSFFLLFYSLHLQLFVPSHAATQDGVLSGFLSIIPSLLNSHSLLSKTTFLYFVLFSLSPHNIPPTRAWASECRGLGGSRFCASSLALNWGLYCYPVLRCSLLVHIPIIIPSYTCVFSLATETKDGVRFALGLLVRFIAHGLFSLAWDWME